MPRLPTVAEETAGELPEVPERTMTEDAGAAQRGCVAVAVRVEDEERVAELLGVPVRVGKAVLLDERVIELLGVPLRVAEPLGVPLRVSELLDVPLRVAQLLDVPLRVAELLGVHEPVRVGEALDDRDTEVLGVSERVAELLDAPVAVDVTERLDVSDGDGVVVGSAEPDDVGEPVREALADRDTELLGVPEHVAELLDALDALGVTDRLDVVDDDAVVDVSELAVRVDEDVSDGELAAVSELEDDTDEEGERVREDELAADGEPLVAVGVTLGVRDAVKLGVAVLLGVMLARTSDAGRHGDATAASPTGTPV